jgi:hypothetical protein
MRSNGSNRSNTVMCALAPNAPRVISLDSLRSADACSYLRYPELPATAARDDLLRDLVWIRRVGRVGVPLVMQRF